MHVKLEKVKERFKMKLKVKEKTAQVWENMIPYEYRVGLNPGLIERQGLTQKQIGDVFATHGEKCSLFNRARGMLHEYAAKGEIDNIDQLEIQKINKELAILEFRAQIAWGFDEDESHHNWWLDIPGCCCPQMDNRERVGVPNARIYSGVCPWHGWFDTKKIDI